MQKQHYNAKTDYHLTDLLDLSATGSDIFPHILSGFDEKRVIAIQKENTNEQKPKPTLSKNFAVYTPSNSNSPKQTEILTCKPTKAPVEVTTRNGVNKRFNKNNKKSKDKDFNEIKSNQGNKENISKPMEHKQSPILSPLLIQTAKPTEKNPTKEKAFTYDLLGSQQKDKAPQQESLLKVPQGFDILVSNIVKSSQPPQQSENDFKITFQKNGKDFTPSKIQGFVKIKEKSSTSNDVPSKPIEQTNSANPSSLIINPNSVISSKPDVNCPPGFSLNEPEYNGPEEDATKENDGEKEKLPVTGKTKESLQGSDNGEIETVNSQPGFEQGPPGFEQQQRIEEGPPGFEQVQQRIEEGPPGFEQVQQRIEEVPPGFEQGPPGFEQGPPRFEQGPPGFGQAQQRIEEGKTTEETPEYVAPPGFEPSPEMFEVSPDSAPTPKTAEDKRPEDEIPIVYPSYDEAVAEVAALTAAREAAKSKPPIKVEQPNRIPIGEIITSEKKFAEEEEKPKDTGEKENIEIEKIPEEKQNNEEEEKRDDEVQIPVRRFSDEDSEEDIEGYSFSDGFTSSSSESNEAISLQDNGDDYDPEEESDAESIDIPPGFGLNRSNQEDASESGSDYNEEDSIEENGTEVQSKITFVDSDGAFDYNGQTAVKLKRGQPKCFVSTESRALTVEGFNVFACGISGDSTICLSLESTLKFYFNTGINTEAEASLCPAKCIRADPLVADRFLVHGADDGLYVVSIKEGKLETSRLVDGITSFGASSRYLSVIRHGRLEIRDRTESSFIPLVTEESGQFTQIGADEHFVYKFAPSLGMVVYFKPCSDSDPVTIMGVCRMFVSSGGVVLALKNGCLYIRGQHIELPDLKELCAAAVFGRDYVVWRSTDSPPIIYKRPAAAPGNIQTEKTATSEVSRKAVHFVKIVESLVTEHNRRVDEMKDEYHRSIDTMLNEIRISAVNVEEPAKSVVARSIDCGITPASTIILYSRDEVDKAFKVAAERSVDHAVILCGDGRLSASLASNRLSQGTLIMLAARLSEALKKGIDVEGFLLAAISAINPDDPISSFTMSEITPKIEEFVNASRHSGATNADAIIQSIKRFHS